MDSKYQSNQPVVKHIQFSNYSSVSFDLKVTIDWYVLNCYNYWINGVCESFILGFLCSYTWDVPITIVTAESGSEAWDAAPAAWIDIDVTGKYCLHQQWAICLNNTHRKCLFTRHNLSRPKLILHAEWG